MHGVRGRPVAMWSETRSGLSVCYRCYMEEFVVTTCRVTRQETGELGIYVSLGRKRRTIRDRDPRAVLGKSSEITRTAFKKRKTRLICSTERE